MAYPFLPSSVVVLVGTHGKARITPKVDSVEVSFRVIRGFRCVLGA